MKLKFNFNKPKHGWLLCELNYGDFVLQFNSPDVPNNSIEELQDCLINLELAGCFFEFKSYDIKQGDWSMDVNFDKLNKIKKRLK